MVSGEIWHGGDLAKAQALFPDAPKPWIDLSTGINPVSYPLPPLPLSLWQRLPSAADEAALLSAARTAYRVPELAGIVAAPGTQILIELLPRIAPPGSVAVLGPTYAEHEASWRKAERDVRAIRDLDDIGDARVVVLVNPNNPDGRVVSVDRLVKLAATLAARNGLLVVDEAFADFTPAMSLVPALPASTMVLRSFGKTFGLAGLRVGFAVGAAELTARIRAALGPWAVAGPALAIAARALADDAWLAGAAQQSSDGAARLDAALAAHGRIVGGTALFRLLESHQAPALFAHLGHHGIYVRHFQHDVTWLRFGLPGDAAAWARLDAALDAFAPAAA